MKLLKPFFRCAVVVNLAGYCAFVFVSWEYPSNRHLGRFCGGVVGASMAVLLLISIILLFFDTRAAERGFAVVLLGFIIAMLFPAL